MGTLVLSPPTIASKLLRFIFCVLRTEDLLHVLLYALSTHVEIASAAGADFTALIDAVSTLVATVAVDWSSEFF